MVSLFSQSRIILDPASYLLLVLQIFVSEFTFEVFLLAENNTTLKTKKKQREQEDQPQ